MWYFDRMHALTIPLFDQLQLASGRSTTELEGEMRLCLAAKLFELHRITLGQAAAIAGLSHSALIDAFGSMKVAVIAWDASESEGEFAGD